MYRKNLAGQHLGFAMVNASTGAALTGASPAARTSIDGAAQTSVSGSVSEMGLGQYSLALSQADVNGNQISYLFTATGAVPVEKTIVTTACDPTSDTFGLVLAKGTNLTGFNDLAANAIVSGGPITTSGGAVTVGTNNDKSGYTLASFGFSVTVGTNNDKTGYALSSAGVSAVQAGLSTYAGGPVASVTAPVTVGTNNDKTGYALSSAGLDTITLEAGINGRQGLAVIYDACSQSITGNGTSTVTVKSPAGATRIVATMSGLDRVSTVVTPPT